MPSSFGTWSTMITTAISAHGRCTIGIDSPGCDICGGFDSAGDCARDGRPEPVGGMLGGMLIGPGISSLLLSIDFPLINTSIDTPPEAAVAALMKAPPPVTGGGAGLGSDGSEGRGRVPPPRRSS